MRKAANTVPKIWMLMLQHVLRRDAGSVSRKKAIASKDGSIAAETAKILLCKQPGTTYSKDRNATRSHGIERRDGR